MGRGRRWIWMGIWILGHDVTCLHNNEAWMSTQLQHIDKNIPILSRDCCVLLVFSLFGGRVVSTCPYAPNFVTRQAFPPPHKPSLHKREQDGCDAITILSSTLSILSQSFIRLDLDHRRAQILTTSNPVDLIRGTHDYWYS
jgi:hypothetical protein